MDVSAAKEELRSQLLPLRPYSSDGLSENIIEFAKAHSFRSIGSYMPMKTEPNLTDFNIWASTNGIELWFPKINGDDLLWGNADFQLGKFGINEPTNGGVLPAIDLVLVPSLAIDKAGNRLGKGKGFYDRALANFSGTKVGVVFEEEILESLPTEPHDLTVTAAITPKQTLFF